MNAFRLSAVFLSCACAVPPIGALAGDSPWSLGLRAGMSTADGEPSNDAYTMGLALRYRLGEGRSAGVALERMQYDFERPWRIVGVEQDKTIEPEDIDAAATATALSIFYEDAYGGAHQRWVPYWSAALAVASPDADPVTGPAVGGGTFDMRTDSGTEIVPGLRAGYRLNFGPAWSADFSASINHHFADWKVEDRQSGNTGKVDNYTHYGVQLGFVYRFGD
jgi:hypothetical protein